MDRNIDNNVDNNICLLYTSDDFNPHKQCKAIMAEENKPQNIINAIMQCDTTDITLSLIHIYLREQ